MSGLLPWLALGAAALFAGGALYASLVEHPARLAAGAPMGVAEFRTSHARAARLQGGLAVAGCLAAVGAWLSGGPPGWLWAGALLGATVPYTRLAIGPTDRRLLDAALPPDEPEARRLLRRWGPLHWARALLGVAAAGAMAHLLARG
jgi:hypothetical protein